MGVIMRKIVMGCLCVAIVLSGCGGEKKNPQPSLAIPSTSVSEQKKEQETEDQKKEKNVVERLNKLSKAGEVVAAGQSDTSLFLVCIKKAAVKIVSVDMKTGEFVEKKLPSMLSGRIEIEQTDAHIVLYDQNRNVIILNQDLEVADSITIKSKLTDGIGRNYCVLPHSRKIVYFIEDIKNGEWYQEVNECDYKGKKTKQICRIEDVDKSVGTLNRITKLQVGKSGRTLFFCGSYFKTANEDETSSPCFGVIELETGKITAIQEEKTNGSLMKDKMMFTDGLKEKGESSSGYVTCLTEQGKQEKYTFQKQEESQEVTVSDKENYYLSYEKREEGTTKITCYSFLDGACQWEKEVKHHAAYVWYFEEEKMLMYSYYEDHHLVFEKENVTK